MKTVLGVGIVLALLSGPAWGQDPLPRLSGRVLTKGTRAGIPSAVVMLKSVSDSTAPVNGVQTDANGGFALAGFPPGDYAVGLARPVEA